VPQRLSDQSQNVKPVQGGSDGPPQAAPTPALSAGLVSRSVLVSMLLSMLPEASWPGQMMLHSVGLHKKLPPEQVQVQAEEECPQQFICP
jgi:hypothetical protein